MNSSDDLRAASGIVHWCSAGLGLWLIFALWMVW
jgi:hypothetical protein